MKDIILKQILTVCFLVSALGISFEACTDSGSKPVQPSSKYPFKNVDQNVSYVGDKVCRTCHRDIFDTYRETGMARSLYTPFKDNTVEDYVEDRTVYDKKRNLYYEMYAKGESYYQREYRLDDSGKEIHSLERKVKYVVGSGNNVRSYLTEIDGYVYEMPVSWYARKKIWDLSPGYHEHNKRFDRPLVQGCIGCHNSYVSFVRGSVNKYEFPFPEGISCERCHGPGDLHVTYHMKHETEYVANNGLMDSTIVNPLYLERQEALDVCQQCHLPGKSRALKPGRDEFDFRPGMKLQEIKSIYVEKVKDEKEFGIASHPERLVLCDCFQNSGTMTCITCHDPHISAFETPRGSFNKKCMSCHDLSAINGRIQKPVHKQRDDCISCHMKQGGTSDIPHVNFTDHWIRRFIPDEVATYEPQMFSMMSSPIADTTLTELEEYFPENDEERQIRLGIAYYEYYYNKQRKGVYLLKAIKNLSEGLQSSPASEDGMYYLGISYFEDGQLDRAAIQLSRVLESNPDYLRANYYLGYIYQKQGHYRDAIKYYANELKLNPLDVTALQNTGNCYVRLKQPQRAVEYYEKGLEINPVMVDLYLNLGLVNYVYLTNAESSRIAYEKALKLNPDLYDAYFNLGNILGGQKDEQGAISHYKQALAIDPNGVGALANLAQMHMQRKEFKLAREMYLRLAKLKPGDLRVQQALSQLKTLI